MDAYLIVKWLHILSAVLLVGTGFGTAFYLFFANRSGNVAAMAVVSRLVVRADTWFTTPAAVFQPLSGWWLMREAGWAWGADWVLYSVALYLFTGACWLPVLWLQLRMRDLATQAYEDGREPSPVYWRYARWWEGLGYPAFIAMLAVFYLMAVKGG